LQLPEQFFCSHIAGDPLWLLHVIRRKLARNKGCFVAAPHVQIEFKCIFFLRLQLSTRLVFCLKQKLKLFFSIQCLSLLEWLPYISLQLHTLQFHIATDFAPKTWTIYMYIKKHMFLKKPLRNNNCSFLSSKHNSVLQEKLLLIQL
jgi:hypothetical protein